MKRVLASATEAEAAAATRVEEMEWAAKAMLDSVTAIVADTTRHAELAAASATDAETSATPAAAC